jgi:hypothetical protein
MELEQVVQASFTGAILSDWQKEFDLIHRLSQCMVG